MKGAAMTAYPPVGSKFGRYQITGVLGEGGMGVVFSAVHESLGRRVALKVLSADLASRPDFRRRFEREANALARLYSPHIIDVYDFGEVDGWLFIATQVVAGLDLREWLAHNGPMSPREALGLIAQVAAALADAHDAGVIHRDIKPSNVLLHQSTDELFAYVCDFGISQTKDEERTRTGGVIGTYAYMAPERHEGAEASAPSDVYSLGCLLHAALTGRPPYEGTDVQVAMQHLHGDIPTYAAPEPTSTAINQILQRCLAKDPGRRYPTASALRSDLLAAQKIVTDTLDPPEGRLADLRPTIAASPADASGVLSWSRRRRVVTAVGGAVGMAAVVGAAILMGSGVLSHNAPCPTASASLAAAGCQQSTKSAQSRKTHNKVKCWNADRVQVRSRCSQPVGREGLRWVFPSLDRDFEGCYRELNAIGAPQPDESLRTWFCPVPGSRVVGVDYREWRSAAAARAHFNAVFSQPPGDFRVGGLVAGYEWDARHRNNKGFYKVARLYEHLPFSSTVWARTMPGLERVCLGMTARSMRTFKAEPVNCKPGS